MAYAYHIPHAARGTTAGDVERVFNSQIGEGFVARIESSITQDYKTSWNAFTIHFTDECVDKLVTSTNFVDLYAITDNHYTLYYNDTEFWTVYLIKV